MAAITWQNVNAPSDSAAIIGMDVAGKTVNSAFDKFNQALAARQAAGQLALDKQDAVGILAAKEMLSGITDPEQALAMQQQINKDYSHLTPEARTKLLTAGLDRQVALRAQGDANQIAALNAIKDPVALANAQAAAELAPEVNKQTRDALYNKAAISEATQTQAVVDAKRNLTDSLFKTQQTPITQAIATKTNQINDVVADNTQITSKDTLEDTLLGKQVDVIASKHRESQLVNKTTLGQIAASKGMPVDKNGNVDVVNLTPQQKLELTHEAIVAGVSTPDEITKADTEARNRALQTLSKSASPSAILRNEARINSLFNTLGVGTPIGTEAAAIAQRDAQIKVSMDEKRNTNWSSPGTPNVKQAYIDLVKTTAQKYEAKDMGKYLPYVESMLYDVAENGIEIKPGVWATPSVNVMNAAIDATINNWHIWRSNRPEDIKQFLKERLSTPKALADAAEGEQIKSYDRTQAVKAILNPTPTKK